MAARVLMPKGSDTMTEGKVLKWLKGEGESVAAGDAVVEIETDKVDMEVETSGEGVLRQILVKEGQTVPVGQLLGVIAPPNEDIAAIIKEAQAAPPPAPHLEAEPALAPKAAAAPSAPGRPAAPAAVGAPSVPSAPTSARVAASEPQPRLAVPASPSPSAVGEPKATAGALAAVLPRTDGGRVFASPLARRIARDKGVDLSLVSGSGPGGRIVREDVDRALASVAAAPLAQGAAVGGAVRAATPARPVFVPGGPEVHDEPLSTMRKTIATRLTQSLGPVPHFYLTIEVDMRRAMELRESANNLDPELKLTYNDIIVKACAAALRAHPEVNASFIGEAIRTYSRVHIGVAVPVDGGGLITPVIRDCDQKSLQQISDEAKELIARARSRKLNPDEYTGATFSVSNLGMMGIDQFSAIINPPEGAILAVGAVVEKPVVTDHHVGIGHRCRLTLSCDHRVVDGATGARFLQTLQSILENPVYLAF
ncbi:MAG: dihydrolipoamide acetyltransferase family protein [Terriglobia bacterium]|jgi:pyruvate dehydrogenase E2 component (dihydrolipoamide acetyltransferase)